MFYFMKKTTKKITRKEEPEELDMDMEKKRLGDRIKQLRLAKGYTSYEIFAFENNINRAQFGRYERGEDLRYSSLLKVLQALGISSKDFFSEGFE